VALWAWKETSMPATAAAIATPAPATIARAGVRA
jgi:hypothetical protein